MREFERRLAPIGAQRERAAILRRRLDRALGDLVEMPELQREIGIVGQARGSVEIMPLGSRGIARLLEHMPGLYPDADPPGPQLGRLFVEDRRIAEAPRSARGVRPFGYAQRDPVRGPTNRPKPPALQPSEPHVHPPPRSRHPHDPVAGGVQPVRALGSATPRP